MVGDELRQPYFRTLQAFIEEEYRTATVYPPADEIFTALGLTPPEAVRVVILGQDPYHGPGQAHGLAFSVRPGVRPPPSLVNILRELKTDLGISTLPGWGCLDAWARRGVLLLNTVLTVRAGAPLSHRGKGWEQFTDAVIRAVGAKRELVVFLLWGRHAQEKRALIDPRHAIFEAGHPSPLSAKRGFFGKRPFSRANEALVAAGREPIDWRLDAPGGGR